MFRLNLTNGGFGSSETARRPVAVDEVVDGLVQLLGQDETDPAERAAHQDAEPALDLVQPTGVNGSEVEVHVGMAGQPAAGRLSMALEVRERTAHTRAADPTSPDAADSTQMPPFADLRPMPQT
jgi:hypothetical protein